MSIDIPPHRLIYTSVALTRRVTCVLHCTVQQHPSKRLSQSFHNNFVLFQLLEALDSENIEQLLKERIKNYHTN